MDVKIKSGFIIGIIMVIIGFCLWSEVSFPLVGFGVVIIGFTLKKIINKNN